MERERILIHPFGLHYDEITASSLLKIDMSGNIIDQGSTNFELNRPGYIIHSAIHMARPDLRAVIHLHFPPVAAASACKHGLLPICQEQALLGNIVYLDYSGILTQEDERDAVARGLGDKSKVMILRNHGLIVCGETIEEAYYLLTNLMRACETQARLLALGANLDNLVLMDEAAAYQAWSMVQNARYPIRRLPGSNPSTSAAQQLQSLAISDHESSTSGHESSDAEQSDDDAANTVAMAAADQQRKLQQQQQPQQQRAVASRRGSAHLVATSAGNKQQTHIITAISQQLPPATSLPIVGHINMFELDFEAQMRALDRAGHQTGYRYRRHLVRAYKTSNGGATAIARSS